MIPSLVIRNGEIKNLPPSIYEYDTIHIEKGGKLIFNENGTQWAILACKVFILEGEIEYTKMRRNLGLLQANYGNVSYEYKFPESSLGGKGSSGHPNRGKRGGKGYKPNDSNGGGGGSGASCYLGSPQRFQEGIDATDYSGAPTPNGNKGGGNGGRLDNKSNGGLLLIHTNNFSSTKEAKIILKGENGSNGESGSRAGGSAYGESGSSGNGGGSAGGDGGVLIVYAKKYNLQDYPNVNTQAGVGGKGGKPGPNNYATKGDDGDDGRSGYVKWLKL